MFRPSTVRSKRDTEVEVRERYVQSILGEEHLRPERELGLHGLRTSCAYSLQNQALRLDEIDRPRFTEEPPKPIKWGTREKPNLQFQTAPAPLEGWVPPWHKNAQRPNALTGR